MQASVGARPSVSGNGNKEARVSSCASSTEHLDCALEEGVTLCWFAGTKAGRVDYGTWFLEFILTGIAVGSFRARRGVARTYASSHFHRTGRHEESGCERGVVVIAVTSSFHCDIQFPLRFI